MSHLCNSHFCLTSSFFLHGPHETISQEKRRWQGYAHQYSIHSLQNIQDTASTSKFHTWQSSPVDTHNEHAGHRSQYQANNLYPRDETGLRSGVSSLWIDGTYLILHFCYDQFSSPVGMENRGGSEVKEILTTAYREFGGCAHRCAGKLKRREQD